MGMLSQIVQHKVRFAKLVALCLGYTSLGLNTSLIGPSLLDLQCQVNSTYAEITWLFPMRFGGYAVGSLLIGLLYKYTNPLLVNSVALIVSGIVTASTGWTTTYGWLLALTLTNGFFSGMVDNVNNVFCLHLWGKENQPFMQSIHFMFGVGGLVSPLIVSPFLAPRPDLSTYSNATAPVDESLVCSLIDVDLRWPYVMVAVYTELVALYTMCLFLFYRENTPHPSRLEENTEKNASSKINMSVRNLIWVLVAAFTHIVLGMETAISNVLTSFAVMSDLRLTKVTGAYITSAYWFAFTFFRIAAVVYINYVGPFCNLIFELSLIAAANVFLMPWANSVEWCLWVGAILLGLGISSIFASMFGFLEEHFPVNISMASSFTVAACLGEFVIPFLMGYLVNLKPIYFLYAILAITITSCLIFALIVYLCKTKLAIKERAISSSKVIELNVGIVKVQTS